MDERKEILETTEEIPENFPEETPMPEEPVPEMTPETAEEVQEPDPLPVVDVISVDDLLDRLTQASLDQEPEEEEEDSEEDTAEEEMPDFFDGVAVISDDAPLEIAGMDQLLKYLETLQETAVHPIMTTPFDDYTVTEGLLLLVFVLLLLDFFLNLLRRWF